MCPRFSLENGHDERLRSVHLTHLTIRDAPSRELFLPAPLSIYYYCSLTLPPETTPRAAAPWHPRHAPRGVAVDASREADRDRPKEGVSGGPGRMLRTLG